MAYEFRKVTEREAERVIEFYQRFNVGGFPFGTEFYKHNLMAAGFNGVDIIQGGTLYEITADMPISVRHPQAILLTDLLVHPDFRGRGITQQFIEWVKKTFPYRKELIINPVNKTVANWAKKTLGFQDDERGGLFLSFT
jgi:GNAT superfamily N-acetyltransferase